MRKLMGSDDHVSEHVIPDLMSPHPLIFVISNMPEAQANILRLHGLNTDHLQYFVSK